MHLSPTPESIPPRNTTKIGKLLVQSDPSYKQQLPFISRLLHWLGVVSKVIWIPSRLMKDYTQNIAEVDRYALQTSSNQIHNHLHFQHNKTALHPSDKTTKLLYRLRSR